MDNLKPNTCDNHINMMEKSLLIALFGWALWKRLRLSFVKIGVCSFLALIGMSVNVEFIRVV